MTENVQEKEKKREGKKKCIYEKKPKGWKQKPYIVLITESAEETFCFRTYSFSPTLFNDFVIAKYTAVLCGNIQVVVLAVENVYNPSMRDDYQGVPRPSLTQQHRVSIGYAVELIRISRTLHSDSYWDCMHSYVGREGPLHSLFILYFFLYSFALVFFFFFFSAE